VGRRVSLSDRDKGLCFCAPGVDVRDSRLIERLLCVITADKTRIRYRKVSPTFFQRLTFPPPLNLRQSSSISQYELPST
jgi:hypothetical protein